MRVLSRSGKRWSTRCFYAGHATETCKGAEVPWPRCRGLHQLLSMRCNLAHVPTTINNILRQSECPNCPGHASGQSLNSCFLGFICSVCLANRRGAILFRTPDQSVQRLQSWVLKQSHSLLVRASPVIAAAEEQLQLLFVMTVPAVSI